MSATGPASPADDVPAATGSTSPAHDVSAATGPTFPADDVPAATGPTSPADDVPAATGPTFPADDVPAALAPVRPEGFFGGSRLLAADARVAYLLLDDARRRSMERVFGIPRDEDSTLITLIALAMLISALRSRVPSRPSRPGLSKVVFGFGTLREAAYDVAGPAGRGSSYFGTLLAFALAGAGVRMAVRKSVHGVRGVSHHAYAEFHHRYGHLILRNRRRRAQPARASDSLPLSDT